MYTALTKFNDGIYKVYKILMMVLLGIMTIWVFMDVIFREVAISVPWISEFTIYAFSWLTYFGAACVLRDDGHLSVNALTDRIKNVKFKKALFIICQVIVLVFCCVVAFYSTQMIQKYLQTGVTTTNVRWMKMAWIFIQIPINYVVYVLFEVEKIWGVLNGKREVA